MFGRATITLGIGPHSSSSCLAWHSPRLIHVPKVKCVVSAIPKIGSGTRNLIWSCHSDHAHFWRDGLLFICRTVDGQPTY